MFEPYEGIVGSTFKYKVIYIGINLVLVGIVAYKLSTMGLLPVSAADYVDLVPLYESIDVLAKAKWFKYQFKVVIYHFFICLYVKYDRKTQQKFIISFTQLN